MANEIVQDVAGDDNAGHVDTRHHNHECDNPDPHLGCDMGIDVAGWPYAEFEARQRIWPVGTRFLSQRACAVGSGVIIPKAEPLRGPAFFGGPAN